MASLEALKLLKPASKLWVVVKIMVPFWGPYYNTGPHTGPSLGDPKRDHHFDKSPLIQKPEASGLARNSETTGLGFRV